jgi:hypothetical protein
MSFNHNFIKYFNFAFMFIVVSCSSTQLKTKIELKSNPSLCYSMIYKQQSVSDSYFKLLLEEAVRRNLDCKIIAKEILDFKKFITGSSIYYSIADESIAGPPQEIVHPGTGQTPR